MRVLPVVLVSVVSVVSACPGGAGGTDGDATTGSTGSTGSTAAPTTTAAGSSSTGGPAWPGACEEPIAAVPLVSGRLSVDAAGALRDEHGRDVLLRGVNTGGRSKWAPFVPFPLAPEAAQAEVEAAAQAFFARLPAWGVNVVRMPFSWEALEPTPGQYDARYLDRYAAMIAAAWSQGVRVIVDFHQDVYASPFCGDGFPLWTLPGDPGPPKRDCPNWGFGYLTDVGVREAFDRFWADDGEIQAAFFAMWGAMIDRVGEMPGVVALEILNEPGWGTAPSIPEWKQSVLNPFHAAAVTELRARAGEELLLVFDNPGIEAVGLQAVTHVRPAGEGLVYGPHLYDPGLINSQPWSGMMPEPLIDEYADFAAAEQIAVLVGEFGVGDGADGGLEWLGRALDRMDARRVSGTLWECSQSEELWNEEDLSVLSAAGEEREMLDAFVRPYLRAVAGEASEFSWDGSEAIARWTAGEGVTEIAVPARRFPDGSKDITLETLSGPAGACFTLDAGELRVSAPAGARVEVRVRG